MYLTHQSAFLWKGFETILQLLREAKTDWTTQLSQLSMCILYQRIKQRLYEILHKLSNHINQQLLR